MEGVTDVTLHAVVHEDTYNFTKNTNENAAILSGVLMAKVGYVLIALISRIRKLLTSERGFLT